MFHGFEGHGWGMGWGWIIGFVILIFLVWGIIRAVNTNNPSRQNNEKSALDILKERYARGEIDKKEFEERKQDLL